MDVFFFFANQNYIILFTIRLPVFPHHCSDCARPWCRWYIASWGLCFHNVTITGGQGVSLVEVQSENHRGQSNLHFHREGEGTRLKLASFDGKILCRVFCFFSLSLSCQGLLQDVKFPSVEKQSLLIISSKLHAHKKWRCLQLVNTEAITQQQVKCANNLYPHFSLLWICFSLHHAPRYRACASLFIYLFPKLL